MKFPRIGEVEDKKNIWVTENAPITGVFFGEIHDFKIHWVDKKKVICRGLVCVPCENGVKFKVNFIHKDTDGQLKASIYENDWFTYQRMHRFNEQTSLDASIVQVYKGIEGGYKIDLFKFIKAIDGPLMEALKNIQLNVLVESVADYTTKDKAKNNNNFDNFDQF